jgi:hypothetical protein
MGYMRIFCTRSPRGIWSLFERQHDGTCGRHRKDGRGRDKGQGRAYRQEYTCDDWSHYACTVDRNLYQPIFIYGQWMCGRTSDLKLLKSRMLFP